MSINDPISIEWDNKRQRYWLKRGRETFYDKNRIWIQFETEKEAEAYRRILLQGGIAMYHNKQTINRKLYVLGYLIEPKRGERIHQCHTTKAGNVSTLCDRSYGTAVEAMPDVALGCPDCKAILRLIHKEKMPAKEAIAKITTKMAKAQKGKPRKPKAPLPGQLCDFTDGKGFRHLKKDKVLAEFAVTFTYPEGTFVTYDLCRECLTIEKRTRKLLFQQKSRGVITQVVDLRTGEEV